MKPMGNWAFPQVKDQIFSFQRAKQEATGGEDTSNGDLEKVIRIRAENAGTLESTSSSKPISYLPFFVISDFLTLKQQRTLLLNHHKKIFPQQEPRRLPPLETD